MLRVMTFPTSLRPLAVLSILVLVALVAVGCGGSGGGSATASKQATQDAARVQFAQCMRDNGVNIPDTPGANGGGGPPANIDQTKLQAAQKACQKYRQAAVGTITPAQQQAFRDAFTKFASCMRQHGVDLPAPTPGGGGGGPGGGGGGIRARLNQSDPKVKAAQTACQDKLPQRGPGGGLGVRGPN
jgi:hypothetical protein